MCLSHLIYTVRPCLIHNCHAMLWWKKAEHFRKENPLENIWSDMRDMEQWRKRYGWELEEIYNEPSRVNVIKSSRLGWAGHVARMDDSELPKRYYGQTLEVNDDVANRNQDGLTGWWKTQGNWVVEIDGRMTRIEVAGDIFWSRPRPTHQVAWISVNLCEQSSVSQPFPHWRTQPIICCIPLNPDLWKRLQVSKQAVGSPRKLHQYRQ